MAWRNFEITDSDRLSSPLPGASISAVTPKTNPSKAGICGDAGCLPALRAANSANRAKTSARDVPAKSRNFTYAPRSRVFSLASKKVVVSHEGACLMDEALAASSKLFGMTR